MAIRFNKMHSNLFLMNLSSLSENPALRIHIKNLPQQEQSLRLGNYKVKHSDFILQWGNPYLTPDLP